MAGPLPSGSVSGHLSQGFDEDVCKCRHGCRAFAGRLVQQYLDLRQRWKTLPAPDNPEPRNQCAFRHDGTIMPESALVPGLRVIGSGQGFPTLPQIEILLYETPGESPAPVATFADILVKTLAQVTRNTA